jgi:hypothetical protein
VGAVLLAAGTGWSQNRLGEVAGSIKLDPKGIVKKDGFVEDRQAAQKEDREIFATALSAGSATADALVDLIEEARGAALYHGDEGITDRLAVTALELDTRLAEFDPMRLSGVFDRPMETARGAVVFCTAATNGVREELARRGVAFTLAREQIARCSQELHRAENQLAAVGNAPAASAAMVADADAPTASLTDEEIVVAACESVDGQDREAVDACEGRQYRALAALESRTPENELLAAAVFEGIREICMESNPVNFEERNTCEIERMTAIRLESE